jgi:hypothetical protein
MTLCLIVDTLPAARMFPVTQPNHCFFEPEVIGFLKACEGREGQWRTV